MLGHKVKAPVLFLTEGTLLATGVNDGFYLAGKWKDRTRELAGRLSGPWTDRTYSQANTLVSADSVALVDSLESSLGDLRYSESIRNRTLVWAAGFHLYNVLDCYSAYQRRSGSSEEPDKSPRGAILRSLVLPGWGQLYNGAYAKFGLLFMAAAGFGANIHGWNRTGGYYAGLYEKYDDLARSVQPALTAASLRADRQEALRSGAEEGMKDSANLTPAEMDSLREVRAEADSLYTIYNGERSALSSDQGRLSGRADRFRREKETYYSWRNQNIWYCVAVYFYAAFDAYVDAHLSGFDRRIDLAFAPAPDGGSLRLTCRFGH